MSDVTCHDCGALMDQSDVCSHRCDPMDVGGHIERLRDRAEKAEAERDELLLACSTLDPDLIQRTAIRLRPTPAKPEKACTSCDGSGVYDHDGSPPCGACDGTGFEP